MRSTKDKDDRRAYSVSNSPVVEKLGLAGEHCKTKDGRTEFVGWSANRLVYR